MDQHQPCEEAELTDRVVRAHDCLSTFFSSDTDTYMRFLNHSNIISTVSDTRQSHNIEPILDHLQRRQPFEPG